MSKISDELRDWCDRNDENGCGGFVTEYSFEDICDLADRIDAEMVELPKDADGEYIHIGDVMEWCDSGETLTVEGIGSDVLFYIDGENAEWTAARNKRHHHEPTVEDVLREFALACEDAGNAGPEVERIAAEYAARLRLAGDE